MWRVFYCVIPTSLINTNQLIECTTIQLFTHGAFEIVAGAMLIELWRISHNGKAAQSRNNCKCPLSELAVFE